MTDKVRSLRLGVVRDYRAENWPSMDLCADALLAHLPAEIEAVEAAPAFRRYLGRWQPSSRWAFNADRFWNRYVVLPRQVRRLSRQVDAVHIVDHSYAHLVHAVPYGRAGVYCHDIDIFRCLLPLSEETPRRRLLLTRLARWILTGLRRAALVFTNSRQTAEELLARGWVQPDRLHVVPLGVAPEYMEIHLENESFLQYENQPYILHVGSTIARKRIDVLLAVFAQVRQRWKNMRLIQAGGEWTGEQREQLRRLGLEGAVQQVRGLSRRELAALYRKAAVLLFPSAAEGFGLPVLEALACGTAVVASDLPALREVGGAAACYCPPGDIRAFVTAVCQVLSEPDTLVRREQRRSQAQRFHWSVHARQIAEAYQQLLK
ncbi:MAG: glycosyltransferase family 4 protein [Gemmataceae bacterium]|nr:glycosyltransferase family 1 protein [Thermogemmata fonticola]MCX8141108.1 glycosyltransferase family 4 protein [Gemmataceae bacterium]